jgi:glucoamylase
MIMNRETTLEGTKEKQIIDWLEEQCKMESLVNERKEIAYAPGWPGIPSKWTSATKNGVGTAINPASKVWFTMSHGIINEIYYPQVDQACTRDMELIVTDGNNFFSEEKRDTYHQVEYLAEGAPAYKLINTCKKGYFRIEKEVITDPHRDTFLQKIKFIPLKKDINDYKLYVLIAPHIGNFGSGNTAWTGHYKGLPMLFAERTNALAMACSIPFLNMSVGFVGNTDGWLDLKRHKKMQWFYQRAENGNIAMVAEINLKDAQENGNEIILAVGFGRNSTEAGQRARASIIEGFEAAKQFYIKEWTEWQKDLFNHKAIKKSAKDLYRISTMVLRSHESKRHPGGFIASLSIPWGYSRGDDDLGGYHLVWPRDLVHTSTGLIAAKAGADARRVLHYLMVTQEEDGHWPQNMWMDGFPYWTGVQMDQTASPILLMDLASREGILETDDLRHLWPMVKKAASYIVANGPVTDQCRWEENSGYSPYTLAVEIAALLIAADFADVNNEHEMAEYLRQTADFWNDNIEKWIYRTNTELAQKVGVEGYYIRVASAERSDGHPAYNDTITISNRLPGENIIAAENLLSVDALALVRFGLRDPYDPRILNTIKVLDELTKKDTPHGPCWYRYNSDGYGEKTNGEPFDGTGIGRPWPLLTGERGHYEVAAGNIKEAKKMLRTVESFANEGGMLPEQIWDTEDIPSKELFFGKATGSAMPLAWAHAEYIKLCRSIKMKQVFDMPPQTKERYLEDKTTSEFMVFRFSRKSKTIPQGKNFRIETFAPARVRYTTDNWNTCHDSESRATGLNIFVTDIQLKHLTPGNKIIFTFYWPDSGKWEGVDFEAIIS